MFLLLLLFPPKLISRVKECHQKRRRQLFFYIRTFPFTSSGDGPLVPAGRAYCHPLGRWQRMVDCMSQFFLLEAISNIPPSPPSDRISPKPFQQQKKKDSLLNFIYYYYYYFMIHSCADIR
jgi:hypothetical protein